MFVSGSLLQRLLIPQLIDNTKIPSIPSPFTRYYTGSAALLFEDQNVLHANRPRLLPSDSEVFSSPKNPLVSTNYIVLISLFFRLRVFLHSTILSVLNGVSLITHPCLFEVCCTMITLLVFSIPVQTVHFLVFSFLSLIGLFGLLIQLLCLFEPGCPKTQSLHKVAILCLWMSPTWIDSLHYTVARLGSSCVSPVSYMRSVLVVTDNSNNNNNGMFLICTACLSFSSNNNYNVYHRFCSRWFVPWCSTRPIV